MGVKDPETIAKDVEDCGSVIIRGRKYTFTSSVRNEDIDVNALYDPEQVAPYFN